jgi:predicted HAD superfamily Cof-like phosphohydrolase
MTIKGLDYAKAQTDAFHKVFGHKVSDSPIELTKEEVITRARFIIEELVELTATVVETSGEHYEINNKLIEAINAAEAKQKIEGFGKTARLVAQADALTDINYFTQGTFTMMGVNPQPLFDIVQDANMAKLGPDGKPIYRESDGKIMKPEGWQPPEPKLAAEIESQIEEAQGKLNSLPLASINQIISEVE